MIAANLKTNKIVRGAGRLREKFFWGNCELYRCNAEKSQNNCGECKQFPCDKLKEWASTENPERIDNLRKLNNS